MRSAAFTVRPALRPWLVGGALAVITLWLYDGVLAHDFLLYDDASYVTNNPHVQEGLTWSSVAWAFTAGTDYWHPLAWLSHELDWQLFGPVAAGHHLTSILWHALNAVLVFVVFRRLTGAFWASAAAAALFAWHPLRVESVAWVAERKDVTSGCFFLLTVWAYAAWTDRRRDGRPAGRWYALTFALFLAGLMCKPMLVSVPVLLLVLDFWPLHRLDPGRFASWRACVVEKIPFALGSLAVALLTIVLQRNTGAFILRLPPGARLGNAVVSLPRYLGRLLWPFDLIIAYPHPGYWPAATVTASALVVAALTGFAWRRRDRQPALLAGWLWFVVVLLPVLGLLQTGFQAMADRYSYLALLGIELALVGVAASWKPAAVPRVLAAGLTVAVLAGCIVRTLDQEKIWRDSFTVFDHAVRVAPDGEFSQAFLGYVLLSEGRLAEAEFHTERALALNPRNAVARFTLADLRARQGRTAEALALHRELLAEHPDDQQSRYRAAVLLLRLGREGEAAALVAGLPAADRADFLARSLDHASAALRAGEPASAAVYFQLHTLLAPRDANAAAALGRLQFQLDRVEAARASFAAALRLQPDHVGAHVGEGLILLREGDAANAAAHFQAAIARQPDHPVAWLGLGRAQEKLGQSDEAARSFDRAVALAPGDAVAQRSVAESCARRRRFPEAIDHYRHAVALDPADTSARAGLGYLLLLTGRRDDAIREWTEVLRRDPNFPGLRQRLNSLGEGGER